MSAPRFRLLAVDLDGTLLDSRREVPEANRAALLAARERGAHIAIVTGRRFPSASRFLAPLGLDPFVVANTGAIVKSGLEGEVLHRRLLPLAIAIATLAIAEKARVEPVVHDGPDAEGFLVIRSRARTAPSIARYLRESRPAPRWVETLRLERDPVQIGFAGTLASIRGLEEMLASKLGRERVSLARTEYPHEDLALLDVLAAGAKKSLGLRFLREHLGVGRGETMAIGDNWNDVDMLEEAGLGVIMGNAAKELRARGFAPTASNDEAGVARAVERFLLSTKKGG